MSVYQLNNRKDYAFECPGCGAKKGQPCRGRNVQGGLVHFGRRLLRMIHETAEREGKTPDEIATRVEEALQKANREGG